jgi:putative ABC transport system permease protein
VVNALVAIGAAAAATRVTLPAAAPTTIVVSSPNSSGALRPADLVAVTNQFSGQATVSPMAMRKELVNLDGAQSSVAVEGVRANFAQLAAWHVDEGSFFTSQDENALNAVAVVSQSLAPNASVGDIIDISGKPFTIVGLGSGGSVQNVVLVPFRTAQIRLFGADALDDIYLQVGSAAQVQSVTGQVEALLRLRHNLPAGQRDDFTISDMPLDTESTAPAAITGTRILRVIQQFDCSTKNICPEDRS